MKHVTLHLRKQWKYHVGLLMVLYIIEEKLQNHVNELKTTSFFKTCRFFLEFDEFQKRVTGNRKIKAKVRNSVLVF